MPFSNDHGSKKHFQPLAIVPVLVTAAAFVLSFLLIYAGDKPTFMPEYAVFTLNTSRIGENLVQEFDDKVDGWNVSDILTKRTVPEPPQAPLVAAFAAITPAPVLVQRDLHDVVGDISSHLADAKSEVGGKVTSLESAAVAKATSAANAVEAAVASKVQSAMEAVKTSITHTVDDAYMDFVDDLDLKGFYAVHLTTTCNGEYVYGNGTNYTISLTAPEPANGTLHKKVYSCENHSALNPLSMIKALYWLGIIFTGITLVLGVWCTVRFGRRLAALNALVSILALIFVCVGSAASHALAAAVTGLVNFVGHSIGISAQTGGKFMAMTWATTVLLLIDLIMWALLAFFGDKVQHKRSKTDDASSFDGHEMKIRHPHRDDTK